MGVHVIKVPDIGEGIAEVELAAWHVEVGQIVAEDGPLADVMTDKAAVEIPSPVAGKVIALGGKLGDVLAVGSELMRLEIEGTGNLKEGRDAPAAPTSDHAEPVSRETPQRVNPQPASAVPPAREPAEVPSDQKGAPAERSSHGEVDRLPEQPHSASATPGPAFVARQADERPLASPAVRKRAWDMGIELRFVQGSGPAGRINHDDLDAYAQAGERHSATSAVRAGFVQRSDETPVPVIGMRRAIARKMQEAKRRIPHFSYVEEIDVTDLDDLRAELNRRWAASRGKLTMLPLLIRAMVIALRDFPQINARYDDEADVVTRYGAVHLGIATQTSAGLTVPVLKNAEARDVWAIAAEVARLAELARSGKAGRDELSGSTITLSSLGALGGIVSTPVINFPEVGIVGVNRMVERPMIRAGAVVARKMMNLSSSFDHRVVDGMDAAEFIQSIRVLLEQPALLFVE